MLLYSDDKAALESTRTSALLHSAEGITTFFILTTFINLKKTSKFFEHCMKMFALSKHPNPLGTRRGCDGGSSHVEHSNLFDMDRGTNVGAAPQHFV